MLAGGQVVVLSGRTSIILAVGAFATALVSVWALFAKVILPVIDVVAKIREDFPIWNEIAERFGTASGSETISAELRALAANDETSAANQKAILARLEVVAMKLSETRHDIIGEFAGLKTGPAGAATLVEAIERTSHDLQQVRAELAALKTS